MQRNQIDPEIRAASTDQLLRLFARLTHQIHALETDKSGLRRATATEVRAHRDVVKAEIEYRTGDRQ